MSRPLPLRAKADTMRLWRDRHLPGGMELLRVGGCDHRYPAHHHDEYVIAAFSAGAQRHRVERQIGIAHPGTLLIIPPGDIHTCEPAEQNGTWDYRAFYPAQGVIDELAGEIFAGASPQIDFGTAMNHDDPPLTRRLLAAHRLAEQASDPMVRRTAVLTALAMMVQRLGQPRRARARLARPDLGRPRLKPALDRMVSDYGEPLTVAQLAADVGVSEYHFMRAFRAATGLTVHTYLTQIRLNRAKDLLQQGTSPAETALAVGFYDQSHLNRLFRRHFGVTPAGFAKACR